MTGNILNNSLLFTLTLILVVACKEQGRGKEKLTAGSPTHSSPSVQDTGPVPPEPNTPGPTSNNPPNVDMVKQNEKLEELESIKNKLANKEFRLSDEWILDIKNLFDQRLYLRKSKENFDFDEVDKLLKDLRLKMKSFIDDFQLSLDKATLQNLSAFLIESNDDFLEKVKSETDTFYDYCMKGRQNSNEIQETIKLLRNFLGNPFISCDEFESRLHKLDGIVLDDGRGLIDLSPIKGFYHLKRLQIYRKLNSTDKRPLDLAPLKYLKKLESLKINNEEIKDISILKELTGLESLDLMYNKIEDISTLENLPHLYTLNLSHNEIIDLMSLQSLKQVKILDLNNNKIKDLGPIEDLTQLERLFLSQNKLKDISVLQGFANLTVLNISINQIENLSSLAELAKLEHLSANENPVKRDLEFCPKESSSNGLNRYCKSLF